MNTSSEEKVLRICFNGKKYDKSFNMYIPESINSLKRLRDAIQGYLKFQLNHDKLRIFNYKGIEIDEADIDYLSNGQLLFISLDGSGFSVQNYLNEYEIIKPIKSGGYGKIFLAKNVLTDKLVAIKQNDVTNLSNDEIYNISREALYLETLKHKNIIKYINSFSFEKNFYTLMQYAEGGELGAYVNEKIWLPECEAKRIFIQLVDAIKFIHTKNVIHRDFKAK
jgi:serine/threonine protein kinase